MTRAQRVAWYARSHSYRFWASIKTARFWWQNVVFFGAWIAVGWPVFQTNHATHSAIYVLMLIMMKLGTARRISARHNMKLIERGYLERKTLLYRLILESRLARTLNEDQVLRFQVETLQLIANFVRCHREDEASRKIFVNLLVRDSADILVLARDTPTRQPNARYPRSSMLAEEAISSGEAVFTGNVHARFPNFPGRAKTYNSILVLPIRNERGILGAVSIDSTELHHFDLEYNELERFLAPYLALLVWTLERRELLLKEKGGTA